MQGVLEFPTFANHPKADGGVRCFTTLGPQLAKRYAAVIAAVAPSIERATGTAVLTDRLGRSMSQRRVAVHRAFQQLAAGSQTVFTTDVASFYSSVSPSRVELALKDAGASCREARDVRDLLEWLGSCGTPGLPVGPAASATLAQAVLLPIDALLEAHGVLAVRWVDDIAFAAPDHRAEQVLSDIASVLSALGLRENISKRKVVHPEMVASEWLGSLSYHPLDANAL